MMQRVLPVLSLLLLSLPAVATAQHLYFCESITGEGKPANLSNRWLINQSGGGLYFLYDHGSTITDDFLIFYVDKKKGDQYADFDVRQVRTEPGKNWLSLDYQFKEPGDYKVAVFNSQRKELISDLLVVSLSDLKITTGYYSDVKVEFCKKTDGGKAIEPFQTLNLPESGEMNFSMLIHQEKPFESFRLIVDVWIVKEGRLSEFVESLFLDADESGNWAETVYTLFAKGTFRFMIYNQDSVFMKSADLEVN